MAVMIQEMTTREELQAQLITKARSQGSLSFDDILAVFPDIERDVTLLDELMDNLLEAGIDVSNTRNADNELPEEAESVDMSYESEE